MNPEEDPWISEESSGLAGPDYVALVIEWDNDLDEQQIRDVPGRRVSARATFPKIAVAIIGVLGVFAIWGLHRLRRA